MSVRRASPLVPVLCALLGAPTACERPATQVVVVLDTDMAAGTELRLVRVRLRRAGTAPAQHPARPQLQHLEDFLARAHRSFPITMASSRPSAAE